MPQDASKKNKLFTPKNIAIIAVLLAAEIILSRFLSISTPIMKIGFAFLPMAIAAGTLGTGSAVIVGGMGDFLGAILFPIGPYFPGFTLTACLRGLCFGLFLNKSAGIKRIVPAVLINELVGSVLLNSLWISILYGNAFIGLLPTRLLQAAVMSVVQVACLLLVFTKGRRFMKYSAASY